jgi:hypothetical protein
MFLAITNKE